MLDGFRVVRLKFCKIGSMQYISHLDLQRNIARVLTRAGIPVWYTKGFNPHAKIVFALPLSVGAQSVCEYVDVRVEREMSCEEIRDRLNAELTDELRVLEVYPAERKFGEIAFAEYDYEIVTAGGDEVLAARIGEALQNGPLTVLRRTKSTESEVDIRAFLRRFAVSFADGAIRIRAVLSAGEGNYLNPELLITALRTHAGILSGNPTEERYRILRRRALLADGETSFR